MRQELKVQKKRNRNGDRSQERRWRLNRRRVRKIEVGMEQSGANKVFIILM